MKNIKNNLFSKLLKNQKGVSAILVAIILPVLLGFTALAIDVGYMYATKNELQNIADAAALAGAGELGRIYLDMDSKDHAGHVLSSDEEEQIYKEAVDVTNLNDPEKLNNPDNNIKSFIDTADISIGVWDWKLKKIDTSSNVSPDAVQVFVRRSEDNKRFLATFFARIFSIFGGSHETFESSAIATAALSGPASMAEGILKAPFGISYQLFDEGCADSVTFNSAQDNLPCFAWHNFHDPINPPSNKDLLNQGEKMLSFIKSHVEGDGASWLQEHFTNWNKLENVETSISEGAAIGDWFEFTWGVKSLIKEESSANTLYYNDSAENSFDFNTYYNNENPVAAAHANDFYSDPTKNKEPNPMSTAFHYWRFNDDNDDDSTWTTTVPVYDLSCGDAANTQIEIIGFADIIIKKVHGPSASSIDVEIDCSFKVRDGRGGGGSSNYGNLKGSIPNLVQ